MPLTESSSQPEDGISAGSDDETLAALAATDREAFRLLYRRYVDRMFSYFAWKFGRSDAPDLTSEVFLRALRGIGRFEKGRSWAAWLYGIAANVGRERRRIIARDLRHEPLEMTEDPVADALQGERERAVREAVAMLPARQREVIELRYWAGLGYRDISDITGRSETALRAQSHRALEKLKSLFEEDPSYEEEFAAGRDRLAGPARSAPEQC
jgi:RNA polymerase sigma-70 factor (ECF subfamily)